MVLLILNFATFSSSSHTSNSTLLSPSAPPSTCPLTIGIEVLNFDPRLELPDPIDSTLTHGATDYEISWIVKTLNSSVNESITHYWDTYAPLQEHPFVDFDPFLYGTTTDLFVNRTGRQMDARLFEKWLPTVVPPPTTDYTIYVFNLTHLDRDGYSHWFSITSEDVDANITITGFFSAPTSAINSYALPGFGGSIGRYYFLDLSAYHWFPQFISTVWNMNVDDYLFRTIQEMVQQYGLETPSGQAAIWSWVMEWVTDFAKNNFLGPVEPPFITSGEKPIVNPKVDIAVLLLSNLTDYGYSLEELRWITSERRIFMPLMEVAPYYQWNVSVRIEPLSNYLTLYNAFNTEAEDNEGIIELSDGFWNLVNSSLPVLFPESTADVSFPTVAFLSNDTKMAENGLLIGGLSRGGFSMQILNINPPQIYQFNHTSNLYDVPIAGITTGIVHEIGHTLGFPHPQDYYGWAGVYVESVMGYYVSTTNFSTFAQDCFSRTSTDMYFDYYVSTTGNINQLLNQIPEPPEASEELLEDAQKNFDDAIQAYDELEYQEAYDFISVAVTQQFEAKIILEGAIPTSSSSTTTTTSIGTPGWSSLLLILSLILIVSIKKVKKDF